MDTITIKDAKLPKAPADLPASKRVFDFDLGDGLYCRVVLSTIGVIRGDRVIVEAKGYQLDKKGAFVQVAGSGEASATKRTEHTIALSGLSSSPPTHTMQPGWVFVPGDYTPETVGPDFTPGKGVPTGDSNETGRYFDTDTGRAWRYEPDGLVKAIARGKAEEMLAIIRQSAELVSFAL